MDSMKFLWLMLVVGSLVAAESDYSGIYAGSSEDLKIIYANSSSGAPYTTGACGVNVFFPNNSIQASAALAHNRSGLYNSMWEAPLQPLGSYSFAFNCTIAGLDNQTAGYSAYVVGNLATNMAAIINISTVETQKMVLQNFSLIQQNVSQIQSNLVSIGAGVQANSSGTVDITSILQSIDGNFSNTNALIVDEANSILISIEGNATTAQEINYSAIQEGVWNYTNRTLTQELSANVTVLLNNTYSNTTIIQQVDVQGLENKLNSQFEDIKRLLREILDTMAKGFNFFGIRLPIGAIRQV